MTPLYPLFILPEEVADKSPDDWSMREAKIYFNWLLEVADSRISNMLEYLDEPWTDNAEELLLRIGKKAASALRDEQFSYPGITEYELRGQVFKEEEMQLTEAGYSLAMDIGLLLGKLMVRECGSALRWEIVRRRDVSYRRPALFGFSDGTWMDPIQIAKAVASGVINGDRNFDYWCEAFKVWMSKCYGQ